MAATRNRLKAPTRDKCKVCDGSGEVDGMRVCADCDGAGVEPTIPELRQRLSACEAESVLVREKFGYLDDATAAKMRHVRQQLRLAARAANGDK